MARGVGDLGVGERLEIGMEPVHPAGEHDDLDAVPAQLECLDDTGRAGADDQHRHPVHGGGRDFLTDHRVTEGAL